MTVLFVAHASDTLYRQKQGGIAGHSNHFVVAVTDVPFIIKKLDEKGRMCLYAKGGTFCHSITMVLPVLLSLSILQYHQQYARRIARNNSYLTIAELISELEHLKSQATMVSKDIIWHPSSVYATWWNTAKPSQMLQDSATGAFYFPDKKLKNTTLGQVERHGDQTSFNPFLKFEDIHPFSLYMAQEGLLACLAQLTCMSADNVCLTKTAGMNLRADIAPAMSKERERYNASITRHPWASAEEGHWHLGQTPTHTGKPHDP